MVPYFLEANPNPDIGPEQEFARAADHDGLPYGQLLDRIMALGLSRAHAMG
jgi:D-alanine-D-alanine ligase